MRDALSTDGFRSRYYLDETGTYVAAPDEITSLIKDGFRDERAVKLAVSEAVGVLKDYDLQQRGSTVTRKIRGLLARQLNLKENSAERDETKRVRQNEHFEKKRNAGRNNIGNQRTWGRDEDNL